jgi:hypothetical protein
MGEAAVFRLGPYLWLYAHTGPNLSFWRERRSAFLPASRVEGEGTKSRTSRQDLKYAEPNRDELIGLNIPSAPHPGSKSDTRRVPGGRTSSRGSRLHTPELLTIFVRDFLEFHHNQIKVLGLDPGQALRERVIGANIVPVPAKTRRASRAICCIIVDKQDFPSAAILELVLRGVVQFSRLHGSPFDSCRIAASHRATNPLRHFCEAPAVDAKDRPGLVET